ncbi:hypothetical protein LJR235_005369 [Pararhizobium sp. LjRoot235]|uniref:hypothetical protein n=1 Tax=Pararhizobium sp. LjRoot235 TaxID=3342291 RepID=UPI003ECCCEF3
MNIKRGLFRLWLVLSAVFVIVVLTFSFNNVKQEFDKGQLLSEIPENAEAMVPVYCYQTRGAIKADYTLDSGQSEERPWDKCWYGMKKFRALFPEYKDLDEEQLTTQMYTAVKIPLYPARPWETLGGITAFAFGVPLGLLAIGAALAWALSGFTRPKET